MDSIDIVTLINELRGIRQALEKSNLLQEDSNKINLASVGLQNQQHQENMAKQDEWKAGAEQDRALMERWNAKKGVSSEQK